MLLIVIDTYRCKEKPDGDRRFAVNQRGKEITSVMAGIFRCDEVLTV